MDTSIQARCLTRTVTESNGSVGFLGVDGSYARQTEDWKSIQSGRQRPTSRDIDIVWGDTLVIGAAVIHRGYADCVDSSLT